jgi:hypothetical protein
MHETFLQVMGGDCVSWVVSYLFITTKSIAIANWMNKKENRTRGSACDMQERKKEKSGHTDGLQHVVIFGVVGFAARDTIRRIYLILLQQNRVVGGG